MSERRFKYAALGDSTAAGVGADDQRGYPDRLAKRLADAGTKTAILNLGVSGATSEELLAVQMLLLAQKAPPDLITLGIGINDLWRMVPIAAFETHIERIADRLEKLGAPVLVSNLIDLALAPAGARVEQLLGISRHAFEERLGLMNTRIAGLARRPRFTVIDVFAFSARELPDHPEWICGDGFHPSAEGYDRWADLLWPPARAIAEAFTSGPGSPTTV